MEGGAERGAVLHRNPRERVVESIVFSEELKETGIEGRFGGEGAVDKGSLVAATGFGLAGGRRETLKW